MMQHPRIARAILRVPRSSLMAYHVWGGSLAKVRRDPLKGLFPMLPGIRRKCTYHAYRNIMPHHMLHLLVLTVLPRTLVIVR